MSGDTRYKRAEGEQIVMAAYDAALSQWPVPYETQLLATRHGDTFVIASGDASASAMVLLHGAGGNSTMWAGDMATYSAHFRVYAVDLPGEAGKSSANRPAWDGPAFAEWLDDVLKGLNVDQVTLVGISQGAWTALKFATAQPESVDQLVLMAPGGIVPDKGSFVVKAIGLKLLGTWGTKRLVKALFGDVVVPAVVISKVAETMREFKPRIGILPIFTDDDLRRLTMPTLLIGGTKDMMRDIDQIAARLGGLVPNLTIQKIAGAGHAMVGTADVVMAFLAQQLATLEMA